MTVDPNAPTGAGHRPCPVCRDNDHTDVLVLESLPVVVNAQVCQPEARQVPRGDLALVVCRSCGHLYNRCFDSALARYDANYENSLHFSPLFAELARELAERLVRDHGLAGEVVAEVGSGPGHFLTLLCEAGAGHGYGFDPSYDPNRLGAPHHGSVTLSADFFPTDGSIPAKLAMSQHVLEHLDDPVDLLRALRASIGSTTGGVVYTEVPNGRTMLETGALWDLIYEHLSYFTPTSLDLACRMAGLTVNRTLTSFGDQFLSTESVRGEADDTKPAADAVARVVDTAVAFGTEAVRTIERERERLATLRRRGPVVLWGAGSKGMTYLNLISAGGASVDGVVDINPRKSGYGVPGTDLVIQGPQSLRTIRPTTVVLSNPIYLEETRSAVAEQGICADLRPLWS